MKEIKGKLIPELPYKNLEKVEDLIYHDVPVLTHFKDKHNKNIIFLWVDFNKYYHRWLVWSVSEKSLNKYLNETHSLKYLFEKNQIETPVWETSDPYLVDIDENAKFKRIFNISYDLLPDDYKPDEVYL